MRICGTHYTSLSYIYMYKEQESRNHCLPLQTFFLFDHRFGFLCKYCSEKCEKKKEKKTFVVVNVYGGGWGEGGRSGFSKHTFLPKSIVSAIS